MISPLSLAIGIGLAVSLLFSEMFGLAAGGMVVPGYIALFLNKPLDVLLTLGVALLTYLIVSLMSTFIILYGKRRTVLTILIAYLVRMLVEAVPFHAIQMVDITGGMEVNVIGYIIPGLIAIWIDRQGLLETVSALLSASVVVRLVMILIFGAELLA